MGVSDNTKGFVLALVSSAFIGSSFILKKKGLKRAGKSGIRAGVGGYTYLLEPLWWIGMITMLLGEVANFVAYVFAPAALVTPLGALSIIVSAVLAHLMLKERLQTMGILGCISCIVGSVVIVIHAPQEQSPSSVEEIWKLATQPAFLVYAAATLSVVLALVLYFEPLYGQTNILIYLGICSLMGSLTVVSVKATGVAIRLTLEGISQVTYYQTWLFVTIALVCVISQLNYLNKAILNSTTLFPKSKMQTMVARSSAEAKYIALALAIYIVSNLEFHEKLKHTKALDTFNTAIVSPIYYVMFTTLTIVASAIMFKDWSGQDVNSIVSELCGFITVISGTILLHTTKEPDLSPPTGSISWYIGRGNGGDPMKNIDDDHFIILQSSE